ncbi:hypothetical protein B0T22DRAFT_469119 [Podospora appendiculata]|uniref:Uncharacterized protein n=1 Tax=Podospora appendiculata TaxID=314037 RepID=A0AAE0X348_9PEZI|nr:hypothetical protein B0T22DRAFT_469119 [Podospora appendiculata]
MDYLLWGIMVVWLPDGWLRMASGSFILLFFSYLSVFGVCLFTPGHLTGLFFTLSRLLKRDGGFFLFYFHVLRVTLFVSSLREPACLLVCLVLSHNLPT